MARPQRFEAPLAPSGRGGGHIVEVPDEIVRALGGKGRIPVRATFNGIPYRGSVVRMGGRPILGVTKAIMAEAGVEVGDRLRVVVELDDEPREVEVPAELARALKKRKSLQAAFQTMPYSHRREYARWVAEAKRPETRKRRAAGALQMIAEWAAARGRGRARR